MGAREGRRLAIGAVVIASLAVYAGGAGASPSAANGILGVNQAFVIGNGNASGRRRGDVLGSSVVERQLAGSTLQAPSDVTAPASFKGFAD